MGAPNLVVAIVDLVDVRVRLEQLDHALTARSLAHQLVAHGRRVVAHFRLRSAHLCLRAGRARLSAGGLLPGWVQEEALLLHHPVQERLAVLLFIIVVVVAFVCARKVRLTLT